MGIITLVSTATLTDSELHEIERIKEKYPFLISNSAVIRYLLIQLKGKELEMIEDKASRSNNLRYTLTKETEHLLKIFIKKTDKSASYVISLLIRNFKKVMDSEN